MRDVISGFQMSAWLLVLALITGCANRELDAQKSLDKLAETIDGGLVAIRQANETMKDRIEEVYNHLDKYDLSVDKMDKKNGGNFETFQNNKFYYNTRKEGVSYYISPQRPVDDQIRREVRILEYFEPFFSQAAGSSEVISTVFFGIHTPMTMAMFYPWIDVISTFPPGLDVKIFEFYKRGLSSSGPSVWSKLPFTDLVNGWVMDVAAPVKSEDKPKGVAVISISIGKLSGKYIKNLPSNVILLDGETTLLGSSPSAKTLLSLKVLEDFDYVQQMQNNTFTPGKFKLADTSQDPEIQALAAQVLKGEKSFDQSFHGKVYRFLNDTLKEVDFHLLTFFEK